MPDDLQEVLLTLSAGQFERFALDLKLLREHGAISNTEAIIAAVRDSAARAIVPSVHKETAA